MLAQLNLEQIQKGAFPSASPLAQMSVGGIVSSILPYIFSAAAIALLIYLVLGGFQLMTSRGDPKAAQSAQAKITNALVGFVIVIFAYFIVRLLSQVLGVSQLSEIVGGIIRGHGGR